MKYLKPEEILNNPSYIQIIPEAYVYGLSNTKGITHYTRVTSSNEGWETVLYYKFIGSITRDQSKGDEGIDHNNTRL
jgi:hypothetical protein